MSRPALESWPADGEQQHSECKRDGDSGDVENVAEGIVLRRWLERLRFLDQSDEHGSSIVAGQPIRILRPSTIYRNVTWLTRCGAPSADEP